MNESGIRPCPFCGGKAKVGTKTFDIFNVAAYVYCTKCHARTDLIEADVNVKAVDIAISKWNIRKCGYESE